MNNTEKPRLAFYDSFVQAEFPIPDLTYVDLLEQGLTHAPDRAAFDYMGGKIFFRKQDDLSARFAALLPESVWGRALWSGYSYKVFSREVEKTLQAHPDIEFCAIVGIPNPDRPGSEWVKAVIQPTSLKLWGFSGQDSGKTRLACPTYQLTFGSKGKCRGMLLGEENKGMRSFIYYLANLFDKKNLTAAEQEQARYIDMIELLTPIIKSYCTDRGFECMVQAIPQSKKNAAFYDGQLKSAEFSYIASYREPWDG